MKLKSPVSLAAVAVSIAALSSGCTVYQVAPPHQQVYVQPVRAVTYVEPAQQAVVSIYVEPPILQPAPILVGWAPPPMLVETVMPLPYASAVWVGGYWVWEGNWVWAAGHWMSPPQPNYAWVHPYYEHRDGGVVFITGHWSPPGAVFVAPAAGLNLTLVTPLPGIVPGPRPIGPQGVFVPPPPGSRFGLIVPAPIGTAPAVVTSAAPIVNVGMRIQNNNTTVNNTTVNNTRVTNVTNVIIVAPASATASGKAFEGAVPAQAYLAAALPPVVRAQAPVPVSTKAIAAFTPTRAPFALPPPQMVRTNSAPTPGAPLQRAVPAAAATATPPPPAAAAVPSAALAMVKPTAMSERPGPSAVLQRQGTEMPRPPTPAASVPRPAAVSARPVPAPKEDARLRAEHEHKARAEAAPLHAAGATQVKKREDEQKNEKVEKKSL